MKFIVRGGENMVRKIEKEIEIVIIEEPIELPSCVQKQIEAFWEEQLQKNPCLFNGEVWSVTKKEELVDKIRLSIQKTSYAHYLFSQKVGIQTQAHRCYNLSCGILLETIDHHYIIGEMNKTTSFPRGLQISGGNLDRTDIQGKKGRMINTVARELKEELGIDLEKIKDKEVRYIEEPDNDLKRNAYSVIMKGILNFTKDQMKKHYSKYKQQLEEKGEEIEFNTLYFIPKQNASSVLEQLDNPKAPYLKALIALDSKELEKDKINNW